MNSKFQGTSETTWLYDAVNGSSTWAYLSHYLWLAIVARIFTSGTLPFIWMALLLFIMSEVLIFLTYYLGLWIGSKICKSDEKRVEQVSDQEADKDLVNEKTGINS